MKTALKLFLSLALIFISVNRTLAMEVAITVDDLPANGDLPTSEMTRMDIAKKMLSVFKKSAI